MPFPLDSRILGLLSVFDDAAEPGSHHYTPNMWCEGRRYTHHTPTGDLDVTVWTHSGTAWVCLRGLLSRRAAHALARLLLNADTPAIVLNTAELTLPTARGGTPLVNLCATLSNAGYSVAVVGREDQSVLDAAALDELEPSSRPDLLLITGT